MPRNPLQAFFSLKKYFEATMILSFRTQRTRNEEKVSVMYHKFEVPGRPSEMLRK